MNEEKLITLARELDSQIDELDKVLQGQGIEASEIREDLSAVMTRIYGLVGTNYINKLKKQRR